MHFTTSHAFLLLAASASIASAAPALTADQISETACYDGADWGDVDEAVDSLTAACGALAATYTENHIRTVCTNVHNATNPDGTAILNLRYEYGIR